MRHRRRQWPLRTGLAGGAGLLVFAALASVGAAVSPSGPPAAAEQYGKKVTICHRTGSKKNPFRTIRVSKSAVRAHLRHGDSLGPCSTAPFSVCHKAKGKEKRGQSLRVKGAKRVVKHLRHGDKLGKCKPPKRKPGERGKGSDKGKGSEKGKGSDRQQPGKGQAPGRGKEKPKPEKGPEKG